MFKYFDNQFQILLCQKFTKSLQQFKKLPYDRFLWFLGSFSTSVGTLFLLVQHMFFQFWNSAGFVNVILLLNGSDYASMDTFNFFLKLLTRMIMILSRTNHTNL
jgi:hypothetical protein